MSRNSARPSFFGSVSAWQRWIRSSDFKANTYFHSFRQELEEAKKRGHAVFVNELRECKNRKNARKLGFISFLHAFGGDNKRHPHIHVLIAERCMKGGGSLRKMDCFSFDFLRLAFMNSIFARICAYCKGELIAKEAPGRDEEAVPEGLLRARPEILRKDHDEGHARARLLRRQIRISPADIGEEDGLLRRGLHDGDLILRSPRGRRRRGGGGEDRQAIHRGKRRWLHLQAPRPRPDKGFQQIRHYGFCSNKRSVEPEAGLLFTQRQLAEMAKASKWREGLVKSFGCETIWCKCGQKEEAEPDILLECSNPASKDSPVLVCPECDHELLLLKDVRDQIKGGFIYKIGK